MTAKVKLPSQQIEPTFNGNGEWTGYRKKFILDVRHRLLTNRKIRETHQ